jgi:hypothetical protein
VAPESNFKLGQRVHKHLVFQDGGIDLLVAGQGVLAWQCEHHRLVIDFEAIKARRIFKRPAGKTNVQVLSYDPRDLRHRGQSVHVDLDRWIGAMKLAKKRLHKAGTGHCRQETNFDAADLAARRLLRDDLGFFDLLQDMARPLKTANSGFRQLDMRISLALDQLGTMLALEFLYLVRERRRTDPQPERGAGKVLLLRQRHEIAKQPGFNVSHSLDSV